MKLVRETLFEQVWSTPISHLCKSYGLSDYRFRKACVELKVPFPDRGHWSKIAAGHKIERPPLLPFSSAAGEPPKVRRPALVNAGGTDVRMADTAPLTEALHAAIAPVLPEYIQAEKDALLLKSKFDWEQSHPGRPYRGVEPRWGSWQHFCDNGQVLCPSHRKPFMRVTLLSYKRAFRLFQAFIERLEPRGFSIELADRHERLKVRRGTATVDVWIREKLDAGQRKEVVSWSKEARFVKTLAPTGRLRIGIEQLGLGESILADRSKDRLEDQLDAIIAAVEFRYQCSVAKLEEWRLQKQRIEEEAQARLEQQQLREEARRVQEAEQVRRQGLIQEANDWRAAGTLRAYLSHLELRRTEGGQVADGYADWLTWATAVAEALDRSVSRVTMKGRPVDASDRVRSRIETDA